MWYPVTDDRSDYVKALLARETSPHLHSDSDKMILAEHLLDSVGLPRDFCPLPWSHVMAERHREIKPCCRWQENDAAGNAIDSGGFPLHPEGKLDLHAVLNSEPYRQLRRAFMSGERNPACHMCHEHESAGIPSYRTNKLLGYMWEPHELAAMKQMAPDGSLHSWTMHWFDFRLSNICNFKCRMCGPGNSSRIASEWDDLGLDYEINRPEDVQQWYDEFAKHISQAKEIYFAGGEPLLMDTHWRILDDLIAAGNDEVSLSYSSNLSTLTYRNRSILDIWPQFKRVHIAFSVDHHGRGCEYIRHGLDWAQTVANMDAIRTACPGVHIRPTVTVSCYNVLDITSIIDHFEGLGWLEGGHINMHHVDGLGWLSTQMLPQQLKLRANQRIDDWCSARGDHPATQGLRMVQGIMCERDTFDQHHKKFLSRTAQLDGYRGEQLSAVFPELWAGIMEAVHG